MMNKKRLFCILTAAMMLLSIGFPSMAEGKLTKIWNAGTALLTETENVSLTGQATFTYDGKVFKVFNGRYQQEGFKSYMQVMLDTPKADGSVYTGGYTVYGDDGVAYSVETMYPQNYYEQSTNYTNTILSNPAVNALLPFAGMIVELAEDRFASLITETAVGNGVQYHIKAEKKDLPGALNDALTMLMKICGKEYLFIDGEVYISEELVGAFYSDYEALLSYQYEKLFGEPMPGDIYEYMFDEQGNPTEWYQRYEAVTDICSHIFMTAENTYRNSVAIIMEDGSVKEYESYDAYIIDSRQEYVGYEGDFITSFRAWYEKKTGEELTDEECNALWASNNMELIDHYAQMITEMEEEYLVQVRQGGYSCGMIMEDGTLKGYNSIVEMQNIVTLSDITVTDRILRTTEELQIDKADVTVELDKEGRIVSVAGRVELSVVDKYGSQTPLSVDFSGMASDYGTTKANTFSADGMKSYGFDQFIDSSDDYTIYEEPEYPETIVFGGKEYTVMIPES